MPTPKGFRDRQNAERQKVLFSHFEVALTLDKIYANRQSTIRITVPNLKKILDLQQKKFSYKYKLKLQVLSIRAKSWTQT